MDRAGLVSYPEPEPGRRADRGGAVRRLFGPLVAGAIALAKWSFVLVKFGGIFLAVGGYALIWGWRFAVGFVLLILVHELGHFLEAQREGLHPKLPVFIPFLGAYVQFTRGNPWQTARVAIAGPILGGAGALGFLVWGEHTGSQLLQAIAYTGFFLNIFNMIPFGFFDGGQVWRAAGYLRRGGGGQKATFIYGLYFATFAMLILGMYAAHVPQNRL
jgi:membrane-associated protease RseP (regulator of RpoE activity)